MRIEIPGLVVTDGTTPSVTMTGPRGGHLGTITSTREDLLNLAFDIIAELHG